MKPKVYAELDAATDSNAAYLRFKEKLSQAFVSHKSAPKDYPKEKTEYADPKNYKYPINSEERVRAAWSYINVPKNQKGYTPGEVSSIKSRIKHAGKKYGIEFDEDKKKT